MLSSVRFVGSLKHVNLGTSLLLQCTKRTCQLKSRLDDDEDAQSDVCEWIDMLNGSKMYRAYPFVSPLILCPIGYYFLDIVAAPIELKVAILAVPIAMDVMHWTIMNRSIKKVTQQKDSNGLISFKDRIDSLSRMTWGTALLSQSIAFGIVLLNPSGSIMIDSLSLYGTCLVGLSPMTPMLFTLINHETVFNRIKLKISKTIN